MRLLHTSDWHLGKTAVGRHRRDRDFDAVLAEIIAIAHDAQPDLIVHSGDLFDGVRPTVPDMVRGMRALQGLAKVAPVAVLAGNHDSPMLLQLFNLVANGLDTDTTAAATHRITFVDEAGPAGRGHILDYPARGGTERIRLAALPFVHANRVIAHASTAAVTTGHYAAHLRKIQADLGQSLRHGYRHDADVLIFTAHLYLDGALLASTERPSETNDSYAVDALTMPPVAYAALGHIHRPQQVTRAGFAARYAGSPLQLDFGEAGEDKSVVVVDASPSGTARVEVVPLRAGRRLVELDGTLDQIVQQAAVVGDAIVKVIVDIPVPDPRLAETVAAALPDVTIAAVEPRCAGTAITILSRDNAVREERDLPDLFRDYLEAVGTRNAVADHVLFTFAAILADAHAGNSVLPEEKLLGDVLRHPASDPAQSGEPPHEPRTAVAAKEHP
ncbi:MAG: repair protein SbcD/Mre11 [Actinoplanes sp.]|nr:repair protein SbcD/Mre11 [Actinoplanes sp.]